MIQLRLADNVGVFGQPFPVSVTIYKDGVPVTPSAAFLTLKDPNGSELIAGEEMAISDNSATYEIPANTFQQAALNYVLIVQVKAAESDHIDQFLVHSVKYKLSPSVTDDDLQKRFTELVNQLWPEPETTYHDQIVDAWKTLIKDIKKALGTYAYVHGLIDDNQVRELHIAKIFERIFFSLASDPDSIWWQRYNEMKEEYDNLLSGLDVEYDTTQDGTIDETRQPGEIPLER